MANHSGIPLDPFAVDFFGGKNQPSVETDSSAEKAAENKKRNKTNKKSDWYKNLTRLTNAEAEFSYLLQNLPENLTENAAQTIERSFARFTFRHSENVKCSLLSVSEVNLNEVLEQSTRSPQVFLTLSCQPHNFPALIILNAEFARSIIDFILGGQGSAPGTWQNISAIENTILEFLAVNILSDINNFLGEPLLWLQNVKSEPTVLFDNFERGAEFILSLEFDDFKGIINLLAPQSFLNGLDKSQNPLLIKKSEWKTLFDFEKIIRKLDLRLQIGTTFLDANTLLYLEADDIVLIEQPQINWKNGNFSENAQICIGRGRNFQFRGTVENNELHGDLNFKIGEILSEEARRTFTPAKFKMDEIENQLSVEANLEKEPLSEEKSEENLDEQIAAALENVQVALRVEIAGNKLSLRELQKLRTGQIIALGCRPTDPVRLVTDHNEEPVATGELVEIEGQLGVRLTKVFI